MAGTGRFRVTWDERAVDDEGEVAGDVPGEVIPRVPRSRKPSVLHDPLQIPIKFPSNICMAGTTASGKTYLLRAFVKRHAANWKKVLAFVGSGKLNGDYDWIPSTSIFDPNDTARLERIIAFQTKLRKAGHRHPILLIFDDFIGCLELRGRVGSMVDRLISSGRHLNISVIFLTQRLSKHLTPTVRDNCAHWFIMNLGAASIRGLVYEQQSDYSDPYAFSSVYTKHRRTHQYGPMVIQTNAPPNSPTVLFCTQVR